MHYQTIAVQELENHARAMLESLGIRATREKAGTLRIHASLPPEKIQDNIRGLLPSADIQLQAEGDGATGTVKVADVKSYDE
ncbi:MAG: hypothetical protein OXL96_21145 [Candidatus Poribacteria bacterium]|nr:hypothetical protein [Candidatus Poribacteria bacterium]